MTAAASGAFCAPEPPTKSPAQVVASMSDVFAAPQEAKKTAQLAPGVRSFVEKAAALCTPDRIHICDGSEAEFHEVLMLQERQGTLVPLPKYENCWLARTNPADVARVESRTFVCTARREDTVPATQGPTSAGGGLGNWLSPEEYTKAIQQRFPGCMKGRTMYVIPFSMGPVGSPLAKLGVEVTDSPYVVASMRIMTRMGSQVLEYLTNNQGEDFVRCLHSVGRPVSGVVEMPSWPCDPERTIVLHNPATNEIASYGSGYGGNSLLGKKCFALRIGSSIARREGWLAEHMLVLGITNPDGVKRYIAAAFPSACGKTNLAMMTPTLPGYKVECVGDDIAWMRVDSKGQLRAINPENGFFGVAPGTSVETNPNAMKTAFKNTVFTNVASTSDGGVFWEGLENALAPHVKILDWRGRPWNSKDAQNGRPAAHPNSRFCSPASQCPTIDSAWEDPEGVPISAILFGGRRPVGVPLVHEALSWSHGIFLGASMRSEATAAAEHKGKVILHDPFAMRPFFGYNFGHYLQHWLDMEQRILDAKGAPLPKMFHVNWFRKDASGRFLWPGYGDNVRVLDWILRRIDNEPCFVETSIGRIPKRDSLNLDGIVMPIEFDQLFSISRSFWLKECEDIGQYFRNQVGADLPPAMEEQLRSLQTSISQLPPDDGAQGITESESQGDRVEPTETKVAASESVDNEEENAMGANRSSIATVREIHMHSEGESDVLPVHKEDLGEPTKFSADGTTSDGHTVSRDIVDNQLGEAEIGANQKVVDIATIGPANGLGGDSSNISAPEIISIISKVEVRAPDIAVNKNDVDAVGLGANNNAGVVKLVKPDIPMPLPRCCKIGAEERIGRERQVSSG